MVQSNFRLMFSSFRGTKKYQHIIPLIYPGRVKYYINKRKKADAAQKSIHTAENTTIILFDTYAL